MAPDPDTPYGYETDVTTRLELVARAVLDPRARGELCNRYAPVVCTFYRGFLGDRPNARADALELTHGFLIHYFLEHPEGGQPPFANYLAGPAGERGRFRDYTLRAARNYGVDDHRHRTNQAHGGGRKRVELDPDPDRFADWLAARELRPDERVEVAYTLSLLWQAAVRVRQRMEARPADPLGRAFHDALSAGGVPPFAALAAAAGVTAKFVRDRWEAFRADRALVPFLLNPPPPYAGLAAELGTTTDALFTRFTRLRAPVRLELQRLMADELGTENPVEAAAEVTRMLDVLGRMAGGPDFA